MAAMTYGQVLLAVFVGIIALQTCTAQIKFEALTTMSCHTCAHAASNDECNASPQQCANANDACMAVVWAYPDGRQRIYKQCVPPAFCQDFQENDCLSTKHIQRCRYCCTGALCNRGPVYIKPGKWDPTK